MLRCYRHPIQLGELGVLAVKKSKFLGRENELGTDASENLNIPQHG
jgi:hypothetical protein